MWCKYYFCSCKRLQKCHHGSHWGRDSISCCNNRRNSSAWYVVCKTRFKNAKQNMTHWSKLSRYYKDWWMQNWNHAFGDSQKRKNRNCFLIRHSYLWGSVLDNMKRSRTISYCWNRWWPFEWHKLHWLFGIILKWSWDKRCHNDWRNRRQYGGKSLWLDSW